jgi:hypothetical protein
VVLNRGGEGTGAHTSSRRQLNSTALMTGAVTCHRVITTQEMAAPSAIHGQMHLAASYSTLQGLVASSCIIIAHHSKMGYVRSAQQLKPSAQSETVRGDSVVQGPGAPCTHAPYTLLNLSEPANKRLPQQPYVWVSQTDAASGPRKQRVASSIHWLEVKPSFQNEIPWRYVKANYQTKMLWLEAKPRC